MGTPCLVRVYDGEDICLTMRFQYDGYFEGGIGEDLKNLLENTTAIVNGYGLHMSSPSFFNGMGCLAAHLVSKYKTRIGNVYLVPENYKEDFLVHEYNIKVEETEVVLECKAKNEDDLEFRFDIYRGACG